MLIPAKPDLDALKILDERLRWRSCVAPLGVDRFGQTGNLAELYAAYRLDESAITEAIAEILLPKRI